MRLSFFINFSFIALAFLPLSVQADIDPGNWSVKYNKDRTTEAMNCPLKELIFSCFGDYCHNGEVKTFFTNLGFKHDEAGKTELGPVIVTLTSGNKKIGIYKGKRFVPEGKGYVQIDLDGQPHTEILSAWKETDSELIATLPTGERSTFVTKYASFSWSQVSKNCK